MMLREERDERTIPALSLECLQSFFLERFNAKIRIVLIWTYSSV
jgi:hypothetical protein